MLNNISRLNSALIFVSCISLTFLDVSKVISRSARVQLLLVSNAISTLHFMHL